jgi:hypothetical protein
MITLTREEAQQVLDALQELNRLSVGENAICLPAEIDDAMEVLEARLAQPEPDIVQDAVVYGTGIAKDGERIDPASIYKEPEPEPAAYGVLDDDGQIDWTAEYPFSNEPGWPDSVPLYTAPPQREECCAECGKKSSDGWALYCVKCSEREWQGLTGEERYSLMATLNPLAFSRAIEAKLKEKNT